MIKLLYQHISDYLLTELPPAYHRQFYSWMEEGEIVNEGRQVTEQGQTLFYLEYKAEFLFHEFPYQEINPLRIMALINEWLNKHDEVRDLIDAYRIPFDLNIIDDKVADLGITIEIREPINVLQTSAEQAEFCFDNQYYRFAELEVQTAKQVNLSVEQQSVQDLVVAIDD